MSHFLFDAFFLLVLVVAMRSNKVIAYSTGLLAAISYGLLLWSTTHLLLEPFLLLGCGVLADEKAVARDMPVMVGPLLDGVGQIRGIVVIESLPLLKFTPSSIRLFSSILLLASIALQASFLTQENDTDESIKRITTGEIEENGVFKLQGVA
jgi:hypothetical protein